MVRHIRRKPKFQNNDSGIQDLVPFTHSSPFGSGSGVTIVRQYESTCITSQQTGEYIDLIAGKASDDFYTLMKTVTDDPDLKRDISNEVFISIKNHSRYQIVSVTKDMDISTYDIRTEINAIPYATANTGYRTCLTIRALVSFSRNAMGMIDLTSKHFITESYKSVTKPPWVS